MYAPSQSETGAPLFHRLYNKGGHIVIKTMAGIAAAMTALTATGVQAAEVLNPGTGAPYMLTSTAYSQNFNSLKSVTSDPTPANALPAGWQAFESGSAANGSYQFGSSSSNTPGVWSYGSGSDRALGAHADTQVPLMYIGAVFQNGMAGVIDGLAINYTGEQWQNGFNRATLQFQYSTDATAINNGTWTSFSGLDFVAPSSAAQAYPFGISSTNGNNASFRAPVSGAINGLSIGAGETFGVRWALTDIDPAGVSSDDGLAVDDFSLTASLGAVAAVPEPATWAMMMSGFGLIGGSLRRRRRANVSFA